MNPDCHVAPTRHVLPALHIECPRETPVHAPAMPDTAPRKFGGRLQLHARIVANINYFPRRGCRGRSTSGRAPGKDVEELVEQVAR